MDDYKRQAPQENSADYTSVLPMYEADTTWTPLLLDTGAEGEYDLPQENMRRV